MSIFKRNPEPTYNPQRPQVADQAQTQAPVPAPPPVRVSSAAQPMSTPQVQPTSAPAPRQDAAVLDKKTEITGTMHSDGNVLVEGVFHGEIEAKETVWIEKGAQSQGQLRANDAVISGSVDGEIECKHRLQVAATAVVSGEIRTPVLVIEEGATINCRFNMERTARVSK